MNQPQPYRVRRRRFAWSRAEVIVVVGAILLLVTLLLPWLAQSTQYQRVVNCEQRLIEVGRTMQFVAEVNGDAVPGYAAPLAISASGEEQGVGWPFRLLPYLDRSLDQATRRLPGPDVYGRWNKVAAAHGPAGSNEWRGTLPEAFIPTLICPNDPRLRADGPRGPWTSFVANCGMPDVKPRGDFPADWPANGVFFDQWKAKSPPMLMRWIEDHDGLAQTFLFSENVDAKLWTDTTESAVGFVWSPGDAAGHASLDSPVLYLNQDRGHADGTPRYARPSSFHTQGIVFVYADGHTRVISEDLDFLIYCLQMAPDDTGTRYPGAEKFLNAPYRREPEATNEPPPASAPR